MTINKSTILLFLLLMGSSLIAQVNIKSIPNDPAGLSYPDVYENIHYDQTYRPQIHYAPLTGEIADATGLILYKGTYHLFYMFDEWSKHRHYNKNWGHAVSNDLIYWEQKPQILNSVLDNQPGSGSGIVDWNNTLGLQTGVERVMVVFYTDYVRGICLAFSKDAGNTWIRHKNNPIIPMPSGSEKARDPLVFWYKPDQSWRMVLYEKQGFTFYKSTDLVKWDYLSKLNGFFECPDLLHMPVDGDESNKKWVIIDGDGTYRIGDFNGNEFITEMKENLKVDYGDIYGTQTWEQSYEGDGPFFQLAFIKGDDPAINKTWSKQQCFPCELTIKSVNGEIKLCRNPIKGIKELRYESFFLKDTLVKATTGPLELINGDVAEIDTEIEINDALELGFNIRGEKLVYSVKDNELSFMGVKTKLLPNSNKNIKLRLIVDRSSIEVFVNQGEITFTKLFFPDPNNKKIEFFTKSGNIKISRMEIYLLKSIWLKREQELGYYRVKGTK